MNEKHAREARIVNRSIPNGLRKKRTLEVDERGVITVPAGRYKVARAVKRNWDSKPHRARGVLSGYWRTRVVEFAAMRGVVPKSVQQARAQLAREQREDFVINARPWFNALSRGKRARIRRMFNRGHAIARDAELPAPPRMLS